MKVADPHECYQRLVPWFGHRFVKVWWDKFGTGTKDAFRYECRYCGGEPQ